MKLQVRANLFFDKEDEAEDFYHDCEVAYPKSITINPNTPEAELATIELILNKHDEDPNIPCELLKSLPPTL